MGSAASSRASPISTDRHTNDNNTIVIDENRSNNGSLVVEVPHESYSTPLKETTSKNPVILTSSVKCVPTTPVGNDALVYKYYCPLCMQHFNRMLNVRCCRNYICKFCCSDYLESKGLSDDMINGEDCNILLEEVPCPHCTCKGFFSYPVEDSEEVRDYRGDQISKKSLFSPLKVGDGFDELKRKMIPYQSSDFNKAVTPKKDSESDVGIFFYSPTSITDRFSPLDHRHQDFESPQLFPHLDSLRNSDLLSDSHIDAIGEDILQLEQSFGDNQTGLSERTLGIIRARAVELVSEVIQRVLSQQPDYYSAFDMVPQFVMGHIVQNYVDKIIANVSHQSDNSSNARNALVSQ